MRPASLFYIFACAVAALVPLLSAEPGRSTLNDPVFPGWPFQFDGKVLTALPLTELEQRFAKDFPGRIGRFSDGRREIVIRWVTEPTRKLHPASDCFQGIGYSVKPLALHRDTSNSLWSSFVATKGNYRVRVYERINSDAGETWSDVSAWYWSALRDGSGSWWAVTIAEKEF